MRMNETTQKDTLRLPASLAIARHANVIRHKLNYEKYPSLTKFKYLTPQMPEDGLPVCTSLLVVKTLEIFLLNVPIIVLNQALLFAVFATFNCTAGGDEYLFVFKGY